MGHVEDGRMSEQSRLPIQPVRQPALFTDGEYHPFESVSFSGAMDTPLGCKRCGETLFHYIHGLSPAERARLEAKKT